MKNQIAVRSIAGKNAPSLAVLAARMVLLVLAAAIPFASVAQQTTKRVPPSTQKVPTTAQSSSASTGAAQKKPTLDELRQKYLKNARPVAGQKIPNPQAAQRLDNSPAITVLKKQMQTATAERSAIIQSGKPSVTAAGGSTAASANSKIASSEKQTSFGARPSQASSAESSRVSASSIEQSRRDGGVASSDLGKTPNDPKATQNDCALGKTVLTTIDGTIEGATFTPDPQYNLYTIKGCNFGTQQGQLHLYGHFRAGQLALIVNSWSQDSIVSALDTNLRGESDQDDVHLVLIPAGGAQIDRGGQKFYAARETVTLQAIPQAWVNFGQVIDAGRAVVQPVYSVNAPSAVVTRTSGDRFSGGQDYFNFSRLKPGFTTDSFQLTYFPPPCTDDNTTYYNDGTFQPQWDGDNIRVILGAATCHVGAVGNIPGYDWAQSSYILAVQVSGPRGVDPVN